MSGLFNYLLVVDDEFFELFGGDFVILFHSGVLSRLREAFLKFVQVYLKDDVGEHLNETAVAVIGESFVARRFGKGGDCIIVESEVEDRVHHPRHRDGSS